MVPRVAWRRSRRRASRLPSSCATTCGFIGLSCRDAALVASASATPSCRPAPVSRKRAVCRCAAAAAAARASVARAVADQADLDGIAQADALGIEVDLHARAPGPASDRTRCRGTSCRRSAACRSSPARPATGAVPSRPMPPVVYGLSSGTHAFAEQRLDDRRAEHARRSAPVRSRASQRAAAGQDGDLLARVQDVGRLRAAPHPAGKCAALARIFARRDAARCAWSAMRFVYLLLLDVDGNGHVGDAA